MKLISLAAFIVNVSAQEAEPIKIAKNGSCDSKSETMSTCEDGLCCGYAVKKHDEDGKINKNIGWDKSK